MRDPQFWHPFKIGVVVTPILFLVSIVTMAGHTATPTIWLFPFGTLLGLLYSSKLVWLIVSAIQYPIYGFAISVTAKEREKFPLPACILAVGHLLAAALCFNFR
jgi:hypothetical protein